MPRRLSLRRVRSVLSAEFDAIRRRQVDLDAGDIASFTLPLTLGLLGVVAIGVVPLIVVSISAESDALLAPLIGSFALSAVCTAVVAWLTALVISGVVVMVFYRTRPRAASGLVMRIALDSFARIEDNTGRIVLLTLVAGLLALAFGLPTRASDEPTTTVLDDLLTAQLACLIAALSIAFTLSPSGARRTSSTTSRCCWLGHGHWPSRRSGGRWRPPSGRSRPPG